jgi:alkyl sulfatase BDS1-like metallo-beta-lactamase superfamily hydrolase
MSPPASNSELKRPKYEVSTPTGKISDKVHERIRWMRLDRLEAERARQLKLAEVFELRSREAREAVALCDRFLEAKKTMAQEPTKSKLDIQTWSTQRLTQKVAEFQDKVKSLELIEEPTPQASKQKNFYKNRIAKM